MAIFAGDNNGCGCDGEGSNPGTGEQNNLLKRVVFNVDTNSTIPLTRAQVVTLINNQGLTVSETETPVLIEVTALNTTPQQKHVYLFGGGKGTWGAGNLVNENHITYVATQNSGLVFQFANSAALPIQGIVGAIYIVADINTTYRWSGSAYIAIGGNASDKLTGTQASDPETQISAVVAEDNKYVSRVKLFNWSISEPFRGRVRSIFLTGLSLVTGGDITAADSIIAAFGKLQVELTKRIQSGFESTTVVKFISLVTSLPGSQAANTLYFVESGEFGGSVTVSASGTSTITIPHGQSFTPKELNVDAKNLAAAGILYRHCDASNIYVVYSGTPTGSLDYWISGKK